MQAAASTGGEFTGTDGCDVRRHSCVGLLRVDGRVGGPTRQNG